MKRITKKRNPQDLTLRNLRALRRAVSDLRMLLLATMLRINVLEKKRRAAR